MLSEFGAHRLRSGGPDQFSLHLSGVYPLNSKLGRGALPLFIRRFHLFLSIYACYVVGSDCFGLGRGQYVSAGVRWVSRTGAHGDPYLAPRPLAGSVAVGQN